MTDHIEQAIEAGKNSVEESWTAEMAMQTIQQIMNSVGYEAANEISQAFAQGVMQAARKSQELK